MAISFNQNLLKGIKLYCSPEIESDNPRVWLNSGTLLAEDSEETKYADSAFIPTDSWREPLPKERNLLITNKPSQHFSRCVGIIKIPEEILAPFVQLGVNSLSHMEESQKIIFQPKYKDAIEQLLNYLSPWNLSHQKPILSGIAVNSPGLITVTGDKISRSHIGLHIDSWDSMPLPKRHLSTNRICINLGVESRFLLFVNLTLRDIFQILTLSRKSFVSYWWETLKIKLSNDNSPLPPEADKITPLDLIQEFFRQFPSYPVVKIRIAPGEAYIAPTENMIHDASTLGKQYPDINLTFRGYFSIANKN